MRFPHDVSRSRHLIGGMLVALLASTSSIAMAVPYDVNHQFRLQPGGNVVPLLFHHFTVFAQVIEDGVVTAGVPAPPPSPRPVAVVNPPPVTTTAIGPRTGSKAEANSDVDLNALPAAGEAVSGNVRAFGEATAKLGGGVHDVKTRAFSASQLEARGGRQMGRGQIQWKPVFSSVAAGGPGLFVDPIFFEVIDLPSGTVLSSGELLSIVGSVNGPGSQIVWDDTGLVSVSATEASFDIDIPGTFTTQQGTLALQIANGLVTVSDDSGMFDGLLPAVGSPGNFSFLAAGADGLLLDYDTGFFAATDDGTTGINLNFLNSGEANDAVQDVPEPSGLAVLGAALLGLVGLGWVRRRAKRHHRGRWHTRKA